MVLQTIDKKDLSLFLCDRWFENVEGIISPVRFLCQAINPGLLKLFFARGDLLKVWSTEI